MSSDITFFTDRTCWPEMLRAAPRPIPTYADACRCRWIAGRRRRSDDKPIAGTQLIREYQGVEHVVTVTRAGYDYQGRPYQSLSAIARAITGTRWNGRVFFGLRPSRGVAA